MKKKLKKIIEDNKIVKQIETKTFLVGSTYFFNVYDDFNSKDLDILELIHNPKEFSHKIQITGQGKCIFKWRRMSADAYIRITNRSTLPMEVGKFLVKELCEEINFTIEHLKKLKDIFDKLDDKHKYEKVIFDAYIENNDFYLTDEQRLKAYEEYKKYR
jgi:hypothetical protein